MDATFRILTAGGRGAIAVVRLWGPDAVAVADLVFQPFRGRPLAQTPTGRPRLGRAGDEVVVFRVPGAVPAVELHCHGGTAAVAAVVGALEAAGAVAARSFDFEQTQTADVLRAQALEDLAAAPTLRAAEILLDQLHGALSTTLASLAASADSCEADTLLAGVDALLRRAAVGTRLLDGWTVVIAGRPNVGKSRLFNALAGFERSIVAPQPGVTRDVVTQRTAIGGWPVELADTAGERTTGDLVESLGIDRAREKRAGADLILLVLDRSQPLQTDDLDLLATLNSPLVVASKSDLPPAWEAPSIAGENHEFLAVSAATGDGLAHLLRAIEARLVPKPPAPGDAVPFRRGHARALEHARDHLLADDRRGFAQSLLQGDRNPGPR